MTLFWIYITMGGLTTTFYDVFFFKFVEKSLADEESLHGDTARWLHSRLIKLLSFFFWPYFIFIMLKSWVIDLIDWLRPEGPWQPIETAPVDLLELLYWHDGKLKQGYGIKINTESNSWIIFGVTSKKKHSHEPIYDVVPEEWRYGKILKK